MAKSKYALGKFELRVGKSATGKGLFAMTPIPKGSCIIEYTGTTVKPEEIDKINSRYLFEIDDDYTVNGNVPQNKARYINHSCKPNCEADGPKGHVYIMALRNIKAGEELNYDYGKEYFDEYIKPNGCKCTKCASK
ncbi:MAG: SET domain-containing protein-lysine N-methyltransferase [Parcubacteria group bacterium]